MSEWAVIKRKPITFACLVTASGGTVLLASLEAIKEKLPQYYAVITFICVALSAIVAVAINVRAWFSTSAQEARKEIANREELPK